MQLWSGGNDKTNFLTTKLVVTAVKTKLVIILRIPSIGNPVHQL